jgi:hypothetical protein
VQRKESFEVAGVERGGALDVDLLWRACGHFAASWLGAAANPDVEGCARRGGETISTSWVFARG